MAYETSSNTNSTGVGKKDGIASFCAGAKSNELLEGSWKKIENGVQKQFFSFDYFNEVKSSDLVLWTACEDFFFLGILSVSLSVLFDKEPSNSRSSESFDFFISLLLSGAFDGNWKVTFGDWGLCISSGEAKTSIWTSVVCRSCDRWSSDEFVLKFLPLRLLLLFLL